MSYIREKCKFKAWKIFYKTLQVTGKIGLHSYKPLYLNKQNLSKHKRTVYAANHRQTLDSMFLFTGIKAPVHWVALKRFSDAEDSIFNNNKNIFLRRLTKFLFYNLRMIPVDRGKNNINTLLAIKHCLMRDEAVGIYPEGTTNKHPELYELGEVQPGVFRMAMLCSAYIQPIAISWHETGKHKIIINFCTEIAPGNYKDYTELSSAWETAVRSGLAENERADNMILKK